MSRRRLTVSQQLALGHQLPEDEREVQMTIATMAGHYAGADVFEPRDNQLIPEQGSWAMIVQALPPMERDLHEHIRVGRIFYVEREGETDDRGFPPGGRYRVRLQSEWGELKLWPYEYTTIPVERILNYWQGGLMTFHPAAVEQARFNAVVFYARSRGITLPDAMVMALGSLSGPIGWFEPATTEIAAYMEGIAATVGQPLTAINHQRRAAAKARRKAAE